LLHPKGKDKACGTIFIRIKAVPRLSEDEIGRILQQAHASVEMANQKLPGALKAQQEAGC
jgi:hypothetical protein